MRRRAVIALAFLLITAAHASAPLGFFDPLNINLTIPVSTRARFAQDVATAGASTPATLFANMVIVSNPTTDRNGTFTSTSSPSLYTWIAVTQAASGAGMHFFDGTGYGGFNGAASTSIYSGADADPTTIHQTYTDPSGNVWYLYRSSGHSNSITFTLS